MRLFSGSRPEWILGPLRFSSFCRFQFTLNRRQRFGQQRVEQAATGGAGGGEARL
jgi:hypothetical protein